uniref:Uncharacterized protein n=1 Tax=Triticum urartu TaxID=4572 RepID=A0A8R7PHE5_TRIUA
MRYSGGGIGDEGGSIEEGRCASVVNGGCAGCSMVWIGHLEDGLSSQVLLHATEVFEESVPGLRVKHVDVSLLALLNTALPAGVLIFHRGLPQQGP